MIEIDNYLARTDTQTALLRRCSLEAARSFNRRAEDRGDLIRGRTLGDIAFCQVSKSRQRALGVARPRNLKTDPDTVANLSITGVFAEDLSGETLPTQPEINAAIRLLEETVGPLFAQGVKRSRLFFRDDLFSLIVVDMRDQFDAKQFVKTQAKKLQRLKSKAPGWSELISGGGLSLTIISPEDREEQIQRAAKKLRVRIHCHTQPILQLLFGRSGGAR